MTSRTPKVQKLVSPRGLALLLTLSSSVAFAQSSESTAPNGQSPTNSEKSANAATNASLQPVAPTKPWIVRDPATGRVFQQQLVPVSVPVTRWEPRTIEQTVYEPGISTQVQQVPQTTYSPRTQYVMQPKLTGWWNPFKQPVQAYQYVPVTNWVEQTQQVPNPITRPQWVPRQQKIVVYQQVQGTEIRQQLVQTELPQPQIPASIASVPAPRQPLIRLPILAQQRIFRPAGPTGSYLATAPSNSLAGQNPTAPSSWQPVGQQAPQSVSPPIAPSSSPTYVPIPQYATSGLRPVANPRVPLVLPPLSFPRFAASPYSAPLQPATSVSATASRDTLQSGMQPTVLR